MADLGPVDGIHVVAGDKGDDRRVAAVGEGNSAVGSDAEGRGDAGNDFERDAGGGEGFDLFAAPSEDERISALEADNVPTAAGTLDQHIRDFVLRIRVIGALFAHIDTLGMSGREAQDLIAGEVVIEDGVGFGENAAALEGE